MDGTAIANLKLNHAFRTAKSNDKPLPVVTVDFEKAFDSVSHDSISRALKAFSIPPWLTATVNDMYDGASTTIGPLTAHVKRGIKQGDPLGSVLFNLVVDELIEDITSLRLGPRDSLVPEGIIAYADDTVIITESLTDTKLLLAKLEKTAASVGLKIKPAKCNFINWERVPKQKKTIVTEKEQIHLNNGTIKHLKTSETFKYLGAHISIHGIAKVASIGQFKQILEHLLKAPLKPQQRLFFIRTYLIPSYQHTLALMKTTKTELMCFDRCLRHYVRKMLKMPKDVHNAILHSSIRQGGLGIPSIVTRSSVLVNTRTARAKASIHCEEPTPKRMNITSKKDEDKYWSVQLANSTDGKHLSLQNQTINTNQWISEPTKLMTGANYIRCLKIRTNSVMTKTRQARMYRTKKPTCSAGCKAQESLCHIVQKCARNWSQRNSRHDRLCRFIANKLQEKNVKVEQEKAFNCNHVGLKPDLLITIGPKTYIADVQITSDTDAAGLERAFNEKRYKYTNLSLYDQVKTHTGSSDVEVVALIISFRGIMEPRTANFLKMIGMTISELKVLTVRMLEATVSIWKHHNKSGVQTWDVTAPND